MSYHGYIPVLQNLINNYPEDKYVKILEIGVDRGVTLLSLASHLCSLNRKFLYVGVDIMIQEPLALTVNYMGEKMKSGVMFVQDNSLNVLPKMVDQEMKFDIVLVDGDHNYYTVKNELQYLNQITHTESVVLVDDYEGRWSERDLWYSERSEYENIELATKRIETHKQGVQPAVDEFLESSDVRWTRTKLMNGEPIMLSRVDIFNLLKKSE